VKSKVMPQKEIGEQLKAWNHALLEQDFDKAEDIHKSIAHVFAALMDHDQHHLFYLLLEVRSYLMKEQFSLAKASLSNIHPHLLDEAGMFYYHFFRGMILSSENNNLDALSQYKKAEEYLLYIEDDAEKAELYYKISGIYYYLVHSWESIEYLQKAKELFGNLKGFEKRIASCIVLLGLNCIDIRQYEQAEVELLNALDLAKKMDDVKFKIYVYHSLGLFYANQNHSAIAIRYLSEIINLSKKHGNLRILFLLAQEYCKLGNKEEALPYYEEGILLSQKTDDEEYKIKFRVLYDLYFQDDPKISEDTLDMGIKYFRENKKWYTVQKYSEMLAVRYHKDKKYKQASHYYSIFVEAFNKINEMGALK
jgi:response regulator aspartate phosphatase C